MLIVDEEFDEFSKHGNCSYKDWGTKPTDRDRGMFEVDYEHFICKHRLSVDGICSEEVCPRLSGL